MARSPHKLTDEAKEFVVTQLACFEAPSAIVKALKKEFGISITAPSVQAYDPTKRAGARLSDHWRRLFEMTRARFLENTAHIAVAHKSVRLRALGRMAEAAENKKEFALAAELLAQAAREVGGQFTNHRVVSGPGNGPVRVSYYIPANATSFEAQEAWQKILRDNPPP